MIDWRFGDWRKDVEKKLEEAFGKGSDELARFKRIRFFDVASHGRNKEAPLTEAECREYIRGLDEARSLLSRLA